MNYIILNDVRQAIPGNPGMIHHASIRRGLHEYVVYRDKLSGAIYFERCEKNLVNWKLQWIEDEQEWKDLVEFCRASNLLSATEGKYVE